MRETRAWWEYALLNLLTLLRKQRVSQKVHLCPAAEATAARYSIIRPKRSGTKHSLPDSLPSARLADFHKKSLAVTYCYSKACNVGARGFEPPTS